MPEDINEYFKRKTAEREAKTLAYHPRPQIFPEFRYPMYNRPRSDKVKDVDISEVEAAAGVAYVDEERASFVERQALGPDLVQKILQLRSIINLDYPDVFALKPFDHQVIAAHKMIYLSQTKRGSGIVGDTMGMGKSFIMLLIICMCPRLRKDPPFLIITNKSLTALKAKFDNYLRPEERLRVLIPTSKTTAADIYQYDVIITSYEYVSGQFNDIVSYKASYGAYGHLKELPLPTACLFSDAHRDHYRTAFRVLLDEAHSAKDIKSLKALPTQAWWFFSGSIFASKWWDVYGLVSLLGDHPWDTLPKFIKCFGSKQTIEGRDIQVSPSSEKVNRLTKLILSFIVWGPSTVLKLPNLDIVDVPFKLGAPWIKHSNDHYQLFLESCGSRTLSESNRSSLGSIVTAMQWSIHPELITSDRKDFGLDVSDHDDPDHDEYAPDQEGAPKSDVVVAEDKLWLQKVEATHVCNQSSRMMALWKLLCNLEEQYPGERVIIASTYSSVLEVVEIMLRQNGLKSTMIDGRKTLSDEALRDFQQSKPGDHFLLLSILAAGGLDIPQASIIIQVDIHWNKDFEAQLYGTCHRPGQPHDVKVRRLMSDALADVHLRNNQEGKHVENGRLARGLIWRDDEVAPIPQADPHWDNVVLS